MEAESAFDFDATERYSRHLLMPEIGCDGQRAIMQSAVLIVGAGGLGSPAAMYLAAAGVGRIGLVDYDTVEKSNLQRQIIHNEARLGVSKSESAKQAINELNSRIIVDTYEVLLNKDNAMSIISKYDIVLDATDNAPTRYLLNDACVLARRPLVSASALRTEGQLTIYGYNNGPCYRCIFPVPPANGNVTNCADGGVLGAVVGVIGSMQALECVKLILVTKANKPNVDVMSGRMLIYGAFQASFRMVKLRPRRTDCVVCGDEPSVTELIDYEEFCGSMACDKANPMKILLPHERITCEEYAKIRSEKTPHLLIDVREKLQFDICGLPDSVHIPLEELEDKTGYVRDLLEQHETPVDVYMLCRRGNRSQHAVRILQKDGILSKDIIGGLTAWQRDINPDFPLY